MIITFCGHSNLSPEEKEALFLLICKETERLIKSGADTFLLGGYGNFDYLCAQETHIAQKTIVSALQHPGGVVFFQ